MKQPSPRLDALRAMRERNFDEASKKRKTSMSDVCREGRHEECQNIALYGWLPCQCKCHVSSDLKEKTVTAAAKADEASKRRKAKKAKRNSRRGNPA